MSADHAALARAFFAASDHHRAPAELCTAGFVAHFPGVAAMDLEAYGQFMTLFHAPFTGLHHRIDDVIAADAAVAVRLRFEGLHTGDFMGVPATGRRFSVPAAAFLRTVDGAIAEFWGLLDQMGLMQQISDEPARAHHPR
jgi:predicted ester cyclase